MDVTELRRRVDALIDEPTSLRRRLVALGALTERLRAQGIEPVLVGGTALEVYTEGGYASSDVDLALPHGEDIDRAFADLGFERRARFWVRPDLGLFFEAPAPYGLPGETSPRTVLDVDGMRVVILGIEDLLVDRLRAWVHWKSIEDGRWARRLVALYRERIDWEYLRSKTAEDADERAALCELEVAEA
jgi:hypothetical protein